METQFRRRRPRARAFPLPSPPYLFDGSERLPHNNSLRSGLNERTDESRKQKPEPVQKLNAASEDDAGLLVGAPLKNSGGATLSLYRRPGSLALPLRRRRRLNIISCPYRLLPIAGRLGRRPPSPPRLDGEGDMTDSKTLYALLCSASVAWCCGLAY